MAYVDFLIGDDYFSRAISVISIALLYPITVWVYNIFFHPLNKYPGPLIWRASRIPYMRAVWGGHFPYVVQKLHARYGDVVRTAPNELSFANPAAWDDIYSNRDGANSEAFKKSELWHGNPGGGPASIFVTIDLKEHARMRRFMDPAFSDRAVFQQEPIIQQHVNNCIEKLRDLSAAAGKTTVNIVDWFNFTLFDITGDLSFGETFDCLKKCDYENWMGQMAAAIKLHYFTINLRYYPIMKFLFGPLLWFLIPKGLIEQHKDYRQRSEAKLKRRLSADAPVNRGDIVSQLLRSEDRSEGLTPEQVLENSMLFINAASETTATTLTGAVNNLLRNPESLSMLEEEVRGVSEPSELTLKALKQLPYLNAVLKEALRMCNPNPIGHMRISPPQGGIVCGDFVPGNILVTIQPMTLSLSDKYFHEPTMWRPERWLEDAQTNKQSPYFTDRRKAVRGFGWGPQNCVGEPLGWALMRLILAKMVWSFDLQKTNTSNAEIIWDKQEVYAVVHKHPLDVTFAQATA